MAGSLALIFRTMGILPGVNGKVNGLLQNFGILVSWLIGDWPFGVYKLGLEGYHPPNPNFMH